MVLAAPHFSRIFFILLGLIFDEHATRICQTGNMQLRNIFRIRKCLNEDAVKTLVHAIIISRLDYCNCLLLYPSIWCITEPRIQTPVLYRLHWLPACQRIEYKILLLTFKALNGLTPAYLSRLLHTYKPKSDLRSTSVGLLIEPRYRLNTNGGRSFQSMAPRLWNSLSVELRKIDTVTRFKSELKTHVFRKTYY